MADLIPTTGPAGYPARRADRALAHQLDGLERNKALGLARIEQRAQIEAAKAHAVGYVGQQGMQAVAMLSQMEGQLGQACPMAVTRLQGIADMTALSIAQVVADSARRMNQ
jgi:hypothetical protein